MSSEQILIPDIGDFDSVDVIEVLVNIGDSIEYDMPLITVESDKASMEIPVKESGTVTDVLVSKGDSIKPGDTIIVVDGKENQTDKTKDAELKPILEEPLSQENTSKETISEKNASEEVILNGLGADVEIVYGDSILEDDPDDVKVT